MRVVAASFSSAKCSIQVCGTVLARNEFYARDVAKTHKGEMRVYDCEWISYVRIRR